MENEHRPPRKKKKLKRIELEEKAREKGRQLGIVAAHKKKSWEESIKEHLGKMLDGLDPLKAAAIAGLTWFLYNNVSPIIASTLGMIEGDVKNEAAKLALAYVSAYLLINFFGQILIAGTEIASDFTDIIKWLIIGKAIGGAAGGSGTVAFWSAAMPASYFITIVPTLPTWGEVSPKFISGAQR